MSKMRPGIKFQNYVQQDGVIKETVSLDRKIRRINKWSDFDINKICLEVANTQGYTEYEYKKLLKSCADTNQEQFETNWNLPLCKRYPKTTSGEVGWRHEKHGHNLELYGSLYKSPKLTMAPLYEAAEVIFLG